MGRGCRGWTVCGLTGACRAIAICVPGHCSDVARCVPFRVALCVALRVALRVALCVAVCVASRVASRAASRVAMSNLGFPIRMPTVRLQMSQGDRRSDACLLPTFAYV